MTAAANSGYRGIIRHNTLTVCPNCGAERPGSYCGSCGQNDRDYHQALPPMVGEPPRETFDLDSRLFRMLGTLPFKPGELAVEGR